MEPLSYFSREENLEPPESESLEENVRIGLTSKPKRLSAKYLYDERGSQLFEQIMGLEEYYVTNCEFEILQNKASYISQAIGNEPFNLIELGAGNGKKTALLLTELQNKNLDFTFYPVDISQWAVDELVSHCQYQYPRLNVEGLTADYFEALNWLKHNSSRPNLILFLGSNIGNFQIQERLNFLKKLQSSINKGDCVIIGFDLKKEIEVLNNAYNDARNITGSFNLNILNRINRELGADFNVDNYMFYAAYNPVLGAVQSFVISKQTQEVKIPQLDMTVFFDTWEPIHTESSFKFSKQEISHLAAETGFLNHQILTDSKNYFVDAIWKVL